MSGEAAKNKLTFRHSLAGGVRSERLPRLLKKTISPAPAAPPATETPKTKKHIPPRPPRVPVTEKELSRAILLLGHRTRTDLLKAAKDELVALVGGYPQPETAAVWKTTLKQLRKSQTTGQETGK